MKEKEAIGGGGGSRYGGNKKIFNVSNNHCHTPFALKRILKEDFLAMP